jgi:hypothetical protein
MNMTLKPSDYDFKKAVKFFSNLQKKFHNEMLLLNSWLACQSDIRLSSGSKTFLKIDHYVGNHFNKIVKDDLKSCMILQCLELRRK